ncbi:MAG: isochorismatase family cysteine hydrolase [Tissierellia bacterium]|nr:isochorismatase family cysteine hydrolase [Tissierellia bacterium]
MKLLIVVDMQEDFIYGSLGSPEGRALVEDLVKKVEDFSGQLVFTLDTHGEDYLDSQEGQNLPVAHCIKGTGGWDLIAPLKEIAGRGQAWVYEKPSFGSWDLVEDLARVHEKTPIQSIEFIGVCTDICVVSNALSIKTALPEVPLYVHGDLCAGTSPQRHQAALDTLDSCQVHILREGKKEA